MSATIRRQTLQRIGHGPVLRRRALLKPVLNRQRLLSLDAVEMMEGECCWYSQQELAVSIGKGNGTHLLTRKRPARPCMCCWMGDLILTSAIA
jgi:hypothetical protein